MVSSKVTESPAMKWVSPPVQEARWLLSHLGLAAPVQRREVLEVLMVRLRELLVMAKRALVRPVTGAPPGRAAVKAVTGALRGRSVMRRV